MKKPLLMTALCALLVTPALKAQYGNASTYPFKAETKTFAYISGATDVTSVLAPSSGHDVITGDLPIGFTFNFSGTNYTTVRASSNGFLSFGSGTNAQATNSAANVTGVGPALFPFWDDLSGGTGATQGKASYVTTGTAPNRVFTFEWKEWGYSSVAKTLSFQVLLYENGGKFGNIEYRYKKEYNAPSTSFGATIGIGRVTADYKVLNNTLPTATASGSTFTTNITTHPATDQSYFFGCINIGSHPADKITCETGNTTFSVTASAADTFQWQVNTGSGFTNVADGGVYSGATSNTLTITGATAGMNTYKYRAIVGTKAQNCTIFSNEATLTVSNTVPAITTQPAATATICEESGTSFTVAATGVALTYQWQVYNGSAWTDIANNSTYSGATSATLNINNAPFSINGYKYRSVINGTCLSTPLTSTEATLTVNPKPFASGQPVNRIICTGNNTTFSVVSAIATSYKWQVNRGSGFTDLSNTAPYSGVTTATLTVAGHDSLSGFKFRAILSTAACTATSNEVTLTVHSTPTAMTTQPPATLTVCQGNNVSIVTAAAGNTGGSGLQYQWQVNTGSGFTNVTNAGVYSGANTNTLVITGATLALNNAEYRVVVSGTCGSPSTITSTETVLTVNAIPVNFQSPVNAEVCAGTDTAFTASATGAASYQWQVDKGSGFVNLTADANHADVTNSRLKIVAPTAVMNGYKYRIVSTSANSCPVNGNVATLTVNSAPAIVAEPTNAIACAGLPASFTINATGSPLNYQWQEDQGSGYADISNGGIFSGATTATLNISAVSMSMNGYKYKVKLTGICPRDTMSQEVTLTVTPSPVVTLTPLPQTICAGEGTTFTGAATGATSYKWQLATSATGTYSDIVNNATYSGATTTTLTVTNATSASPNMTGYRYRLVAISGNGCIANSVPGVLTVNTKPTISTQPTANRSICENAGTDYSVTAAGTGLSYQWQVNSGSGFTNISNGGVYSGATSNKLVLAGVPISMNGYEFRVVISGTCSPALTSNVGTLTVSPNPVIITQPANSSVCNGVATTFTATASGATSYQWESATSTTFSSVSNGSTYSGVTTTTLTVNATTSLNNRKYRLVATGAGCSTNSNAATLTVNAPSITTQPTNRILCETESTTFTAAASSDADTLRWQILSGGVYVDIVSDTDYSGVNTNTLTVTGATLSAPNMNGTKYRLLAGNKASGCYIASNEVTLTVTSTPPAITTNPPAAKSVCQGENTTIAISATGSGLSYKWQVNTGSGWNDLSNTAPYSGTTTATLTITAAPASLSGYKYRCVVNGACAPALVESTECTLTVNGLPAITTQPINRTVCTPGNGTFTVFTTGATTYQWQENTGLSSAPWVDISNSSMYSGANTTSLTVNATTPAVNGYKYRVIVGNGNCTVTSSEATLTIGIATMITTQPPATLVTCQGVNRSIAATATGDNVTYQWQVNDGSGWSNLSNGAPYGGTTTATLAITATPFSLNGYKYRVVVGGTCSPTSVTSTETALTVNPLPTVAAPANTAVCAGVDASFTSAVTGTTQYQWQIDRGAGFTDLGADANHTDVNATTVNIIAPPASMNNYKYRLVASSGLGCTTTGASATLTVNTKPTFTADLTNKAACEGQPVAFPVGITGTALTYVWQEDQGGGSGFVDVTNGGIYSGATTATLNISAPTAAMTGYKYRLKISGTCPNDTISQVALLTVNAVPTINTQPADQAVCINGGTTIGSGITGATTYKWQVNKGSGFADLAADANHTGVTTSSLIILGATASMNNYKYRVIATSNQGCSITSSAANLTVNNPPSITTQPTAQNGCNGQTAIFKVVAAGAGLTYRWQENSGSGFTNLSDGGIYAGTTTNTLTLTGITNGMNGYEYRVVVSGTCTPSATSNGVALTILPVAVVTTQPSNRTACVGSNTTFSAAINGASTYQWQVNTGSGWNNISDAGVYSGTSTTTLAITGATLSMDGYQYRILANTAQSCQTISGVGTLTMNTLPTVTASPTNTAVCEGNTAYFTAAGTGTNVAYQWEVNDGNGYVACQSPTYNNVNTPTLEVSNPLPVMNGYKFRCVISGSCTPSVTTGEAVLTVRSAPSIVSQPVNTSACIGSNVTFKVTATGSNLAYQWQEKSPTGLVFLNISGTASGYSGVNTDELRVTSVGISQDGSEYRCIVTGSCLPEQITNHVLLTVNAYTAITTQPPVVLAACDQVDAQISVTATGGNLTYQWQENLGTGFVNINGGSYAGETTNTLTIINPGPGLSGRKYRVLVDGVCGGQQTSVTSTINVSTFPNITAEPEPDTVVELTTATFAVAANGTNISYQWQENPKTGIWTNLFDDVAHSGTSTPTLTIKTDLSKNEYAYRCVVKGNCTGDTSIPAPLTVLPDLSVNSYAKKDLSIVLYPNPATGNEVVVKTDASFSGEMSVKITDQLGRLVQESEVLISSQKEATINIGRLPYGVYNLQLIDAQGATLKVFRLTKQ